MILNCDGYWNDEANTFIQSYDCIDGREVRSYREIEEDKEVAEFDPGERCIDRRIRVPIICVHCMEEERRIKNREERGERR